MTWKSAGVLIAVTAHTRVLAAARMVGRQHALGRTVWEFQRHDGRHERDNRQFVRSDLGRSGPLADRGQALLGACPPHAVFDEYIIVKHVALEINGASGGPQSPRGRLDVLDRRPHRVKPRGGTLP